MSTPADPRLLCQCAAQPDSHGCDYRATAEDMLCNLCRRGCAEWCYLAAEDTALHGAAGSFSIDWDDLDSGVSP